MGIKVITAEHVDAAYTKGHAKGTKEATTKALAAIKSVEVPTDNKAVAKQIKVLLASVASAIKAPKLVSSD